MPRATATTNSAVLLQARRLAGLTQEELASRTGLAVNTIRRMEKGVAPCAVVSIRTVADALEIDYVQAIVPVSGHTAILYAEVGAGGEQPPGDERQAPVALLAERILGARAIRAQQLSNGVVAVFDGSVSAVVCAAGIQRAAAALGDESLDGRRMPIWIGVDVGDERHRLELPNGEDLAAVRRLRWPSDFVGVSVSATVHELVVGKVDVDFDELRGSSSAPVFRVASDSEGLGSPARGAASIARFCGYPCVIAVSSEEMEKDAPHLELPSLMILPFRYVGANPDDAPLAHGLQLAIQSALVKLPGLFLVSPAAPEVYRGLDVSAMRAGTEVGVRYVLEGALQLSGGRIRATVQLTDVLQARIVWAETYERVLSDVFELQDAITSGVVVSLHIQLVRKGDTLQLNWWEEQLPSWSLREKVLRGLSHQYRGTREDNAIARQIFEQVLEEIPLSGHGQGLALIALTHWLDVFRGWSPRVDESTAHAAELAERAVELGDADGWGHLVLGYLRLFERRHDEALSIADHAAVWRPSCPMAGAIFSEVLRYSGEGQRALGVVRNAVRKARVYPSWMLNILAACYRDIGDLPRSIMVAEEGRRLAPNDVDGLAILATDYVLSGRVQEAHSVVERLLEIRPDFSVHGYCAEQPYRDDTTVNHVARTLRAAGLPS